MDERDRFRGCLLGLACGDAVGTTVEFCPRGTFDPMTDMVGQGPFHHQPGEWTDDTSMAHCLAACSAGYYSKLYSEQTRSKSFSAMASRTCKPTPSSQLPEEIIAGSWNRIFMGRAMSFGALKQRYGVSFTRILSRTRSYALSIS